MLCTTTVDASATRMGGVYRGRQLVLHLTHDNLPSENPPVRTESENVVKVLPKHPPWHMRAPWQTVIDAVNTEQIGHSSVLSFPHLSKQ